MNCVITSANIFSGQSAVTSRIFPVQSAVSVRKSTPDRPFVCPILRSRSSVVLLSSFSSRRISAWSSVLALCSTESGPYFLIQAYRLCVVIPNLPATSATLCPRSITCLTASILNSSGYLFLLIITSLIVMLYD